MDESRSTTPSGYEHNDESTERSLRDISSEHLHTNENSDRSISPGSSLTFRSARPTPIWSSNRTATLANYLWNNIAGKVIILSFQNLGKLLPCHRQQLVHLVIDYKLQEQLQYSTSLSDFWITSEEFTDLADDIAEIFPGESPEVYYTPFELIDPEDVGKRSEYSSTPVTDRNAEPLDNSASGSKVAEEHGKINSCEDTDGTEIKKFKKKKIRRPAAGKLHDRYRYRKSNLVEGKIITVKKVVESSIGSGTDPTDVDTLSAHKWLLDKNLAPEEKVREYWSKTWSIRRKTLKDNNITAFEYFSKYACLTQQHGIKLIESDFEKLFPEKKDIEKSRWDALRVKLLKHFQEGKFKCPKNLTRLSTDQQDAFIICLMPKLIKPVPIKRKLLQDPTGTWKPSSEEISSSFVVIVSNPGDIDSTIEKKKEECNQKKVTLQPFLIFVKTTSLEEEPFEAYYVVLDTFKFQFTRAIQAVIFAFRLFFAVDIAYPIFCSQIWQFIQKVLFDITESGEKLSIQLKLLLAEFKV